MIDEKLKSCAQMFGTQHYKAVKTVLHSGSVAKYILNDMQKKKIGFNVWANALSTQHRNYFTTIPIETEFSTMMDELTKESLTKQQKLEETTIDFDTFLKEYFAQL